jgi:two-component system LytT family response regulator
VAEHVAPAKLRVAIVDDEEPGLFNLRALLAERTGIDIVAECSSGRDALVAIAATRPDLVFLDVQMPECDGFDVLEQLGSHAPPATIFVTAYDQHAVKAFESGAVDYLLKPFDTARFHVALGRAEERIAWLREKQSRNDRWVVKSAGRALFIQITQIDCIEAADYYVSLHVGGNTHLLRRSMADVASELEGSRFCRIHRSFIVNLDRVSRLESDAEGESVVVLADGTRVPLSRRFRKHFLSRMRTARAHPAS